MRNDRRRRGFTLAEMLISMALMALIMVAAALAIQAAGSSHAYNWNSDSRLHAPVRRDS